MNISGMPLAQVRNLRVDGRDITSIASTRRENVIHEISKLRGHFLAV